MTIIEAHDLLKNRLGFRAEGSFVLDSGLTTTDSGRYFQDEHTALILKNIHATIDPEPEDDAADGSLDNSAGDDDNDTQNQEI